MGLPMSIWLSVCHVFQHVVKTVTFVHIVSTLTLDHIFATMILNTIVAFDTIVAFIESIQIRAIPRPIDVPDSGLVCDLLWGDPAEVSSILT